MTYLGFARRALPTRRRDASPVNASALMLRVADADGPAFETLYRAYAYRLRAFLQRLMQQRPSLVEEVLNDTMLVVWHKAHTYNATSKVSTWIFAIAQRKARKALRRADNACAFSAADATPAFVAGPDRELQLIQLQEHLSDALSALSGEHRVVIQLTYYQGYDCREIADLVGCPVDTVKTRMFYARRRLKVLLVATREQVL